MAAKLTGTGPHPLSTQQKAVLQTCARGFTIVEAGAELGISPDTAKNHAAKARRKLGARNTHDAIVRAIVTGEVTVPSRSDLWPGR